MPSKTVVGHLGDESSINALLHGMDVLVHAGFDHDYASNIEGIKNIMRAVNQPDSTIKRVVYLSSYVVYDRKRALIHEKVPSSRYGDIYTKEKLSVEKIIRETESEVEVIILQPTIVLGLGGNWSKVLFESAKSKSVRLSKCGKGICNYVYVNDVARSIWQAVRITSQQLNERVSSFLVTGGTASWKEVLVTHAQIESKQRQKEITLPKIENAYYGKYGDSFIKDIIIGTLYQPMLRPITHPALKYVKRRINRRESAVPPSEPMLKYSFQGLSKALQQSDCVVDGRKAMRILQYANRFSLSELAENMSQILAEQSLRTPI